MKHLFFSCRLLCSLLLSTFLFLGAAPMWGEEGGEIKDPANVVSGKWYYLKGVSTVSKTEKTFYFYPTTIDDKGKVTASTVSSISEAMPLKFTKVTDGWTIENEDGKYLRPHSSNGQSYFVSDAVVLSLVKCNTKEGDNKGMKIGPYVSGSDNWYIQVPTSAEKIGGYKTSQYGVTLIEAGGGDTPTLTATGGDLSGDALTFSSIEKDQSAEKTFNLSGANLTDNASLLIAGTNADMFSVSPVSVTPTDGTISSTSIKVTYAPTEPGDHSATLTISSTGATAKVISLSGSATAPAQKYYINASAPDGGFYTVKVGNQSAETVTEENVFEAAEGQVITLTTEAYSGYKLASKPFVVKQVSDQTEVKVSKDGDNYTFEMPAEEVTITANYSKTYTITAGSCTNGAITKIADKDDNVITETSQGSKVVVCATPDAGYTLDELYYVKEGETAKNDFTANGYFSMAASNVTVYAIFKVAIKGFEDALAVFKGTGTASDDGKQYMLKAEYDALSDVQKDTKYIPLENVSAVFESGASCFSGVTSTNNISPARTNNGESLGVKVGATSKAGSIALTLTNTKVLQSIVVRAAMYGKDEGGDGFSIILNEGTSSAVSKSFTLSAGNKILEDCTFYLEENYTVSSLKILQNKTSNGRFYMQSIQLNVPSVSISVSDAQYATYYNATSAYIMPEGLEGITVEGVSGSNLTLNNTHYAAGSVVPAGETLVLHATEELAEATEYTFYAATTDKTKIADNMLKGTSTADEWTTGGEKYYRLSQHNGEVGFYWGAADGGAFKPGANKAYLAVPAGASAPARFIFGQHGVPTDNVNVNINDNQQTTKVMIDGRLYIVREGKTYDSFGRLVK